MTEQQKTALYEQYSKKVFGYLLSKTKNYTTAEDLTSDVFLKIYSNIGSFDETKASLSTWVFTITRNTLFDHFRANRHPTEEIPEDLAAEEDVEEEICDSEELDTLADALERLDDRQRAVILLHYYKGMPLKDIADRMGYSYAYIKVLHSKALQALKKSF